MTTPENKLTNRPLHPLESYHAGGILDGRPVCIWAPISNSARRIQIDLGMASVFITADSARELARHLQAAARAMEEGRA